MQIMKAISSSPCPWSLALWASDARVVSGNEQRHAARIWKQNWRQHAEDQMLVCTMRAMIFVSGSLSASVTDGGMEARRICDVGRREQGVTLMARTPVADSVDHNDSEATDLIDLR